MPIKSKWLNKRRTEDMTYPLADTTTSTRSICQLKSDIEFLRNEKTKKESTVVSRKRQLGDLVDSAKKIQKGMEEQRAQTVRINPFWQVYPFFFLTH
jgi:hypothetical protein